MKNVKRILSVLMACLMIVCVLPVFASAESGGVLRFDENGEFKVMIFADSQDDEDLEETTAQLMREGIAKYDPDLVVFLGDNTVADGYDKQYAAIEAILAPCIEADVPFALVFGNHDQEQGVEKEVLLAMYKQIGGSLCLTWDAPDVYGCGNSNLLIMSSDNILDPAFNLWFIDSGSSLHDEEGEWLGYDYVREDQIEWYENTAATLKVLNGGEAVPSVLFQHIIVPEVYEAMYPSVPLPIQEITYKDKAYLPIPSFSKHTGVVMEPPCPSYYSAGQFDSLVATGDVLATFHGHDHVNDFTLNYQGIDITTVPTVGCNSYSDALSRGFGLLTLNEDDLTTYEYETIYMFDMALEEGSLLTEVEGGASRFSHTFMKLLRKVLDAVHAVFYNLPF